MSLASRLQTSAPGRTLNADTGVWRGTGPIDVVERKLSALAQLTAEELAVLRNLGGVETFRPGAQLAREGESGHPRRFVISGWAARIRTLRDGRRQILGLLLPGDETVILGSQHSPLSRAEIIALTAVKTADAAPVADFLDRTGGHTPLATACVASAVQEEERLIDQVVRLGGHAAHERLQDLLFDLQRRLDRVGLASDRGFALPITQENLADLLGLSTVHVNRILQQARKDGSIALKTGWVRLLKWSPPSAA